MHILDGVLGTPVVAVTSVAAAGLVAWSVKGIKEKELPKIALMSSVFFVASMIHVNIGGSSVHLLMSGIIGLVLGRRTPFAIAVSLILQLLTIHFGGITSLGANVIDVSIPAMLVGWLIRPYLGKNSRTNLLCGAAAGALSVIITILFVSIMLFTGQICLCHNADTRFSRKHAAKQRREHRSSLRCILHHQDNIRICGGNDQRSPKSPAFQVFPRRINHILIDNLYGLCLVITEFFVIDPLA